MSIDTPIVNMNERPIAVAAKIRRQANNSITLMGNYAEDGVPLDTLFKCCGTAGLIPVQEDGCVWSGLLCGGAECGSEEARKQVCQFPLAMWDDRTSCYRLTKLALCLSWGTLYRPNSTRRWEFVAYVA